MGDGMRKDKYKKTGFAKTIPAQNLSFCTFKQHF